HRAAAIGAEREVDELACDGGSRAVRRSARHAAWRVDVDRRAEMHVLAGQAVAKLVAMGLADQIRAGAQQARDGLRGFTGGRMRAQPVGLTEPGARASNVERILRGEGAPGERTSDGALHRNVVVAAEGTERIVRETPTHADTPCSASHTRFG